MLYFDPQGVTGASGASGGEGSTPSGEVTTTAATSTTTPTAPEPQATPKTRPFRYGDEVYELTDEQVESLLQLGADAYVRKNNPPAEERKTETPEENPLEKEVKTLRDEMSQMQQRMLRTQVTNELNEALGHEFIKGNPDLKDTVQDLALLAAQRNPRKAIKDHVTEIIGKLSKTIEDSNTKFLEKKMNRNRSTAGTSASSSAPGPGKQPNFTGKDLFSGKVAAAARESIRQMR